MHNNPTGGAKLPVFELFGTTYSIVFANIGTMIKLSWAWFLLLFLVLGGGTYALLGGNSLDSLATSGNWALLVVFGLLAFVFYMVAVSSIAVGWHRYLLLGEQPGVVHLRVDKPVWSYFGYAVLVTVLFIVIYFIGSLVVGLLAFALASIWAPLAAVPIIALVGLLAWLYARMSLIFPAAAVQSGLSFGDAWGRTEGNGWRLVGGMILTALPAIVLLLLINLGFGAVATEVGPLFWVVTAISYAIQFLLMFIGLGFVTEAYRYLVGARR